MSKSLYIALRNPAAAPAAEPPGPARRPPPTPNHHGKSSPCSPISTSWSAAPRGAHAVEWRSRREDSKLKQPTPNQTNNQTNNQPTNQPIKQTNKRPKTVVYLRLVEEAHPVDAHLHLGGGEAGGGAVHPQQTTGGGIQHATTGIRNGRRKKISNDARRGSSEDSGRPTPASNSSPSSSTSISHHNHHNHHDSPSAPPKNTHVTATRDVAPGLVDAATRPWTRGSCSPTPWAGGRPTGTRSRNTRSMGRRRTRRHAMAMTSITAPA